MSIARWLRHWSKTPRSVKSVFSDDALTRIQQAIAASEESHSGEIRFAIEPALPWSYLKRDAPVRERAAMVFSKLRVWDTELNNGVLIYVELADRSIEIVADRGIVRHVPRARWDAVCNAMREHFRKGEYEAGALHGVQAVGSLLAEHFPLAEGESNPNELSNRPALL
jgi:uncharacterized membrane protein